MDRLSLAAGATGVVAAYFFYLVASKGFPVALAWFKAKSTAGKTALYQLGTDIDDTHAKIDSALAQLATLKDAVRTAQGDIARLKTTPAAPAPLAPVPLSLGVVLLRSALRHVGLQAGGTEQHLTQAVHGLVTIPAHQALRKNSLDESYAAPSSLRRTVN